MAKRATKTTTKKAGGTRGKAKPKTGSKRRSAVSTHKKREDKRQVFLRHFRASGNIKYSAEMASVDRKTIYNWREADPEFLEAMEVALEDYCDGLEQEADRRAVEGTIRPVYYRGEKCGGVTEYSDTLLMFRLNGLRPDKYKRYVRNEHTGPGGGPIRGHITHGIDLTKLSTHELVELRRLRLKASVD